MTRINLIPVEELSDQNLIAEYHELPRVLRVSLDNAPEKYCLGKGHMKWAKLHLQFICTRYLLLCMEMYHRDFTVNYPPVDFLDYAFSKCGSDFTWQDYIPTEEDISLSRDRIIQRYNKNHRWTKRNKPEYLQ